MLADSYQACGAIDLDVASLGADAITGGTVKYLLGTAGLGFMWVRPEVRDALLPTQTGWFADEDIFAMSIADYSPHASARRFDSGTPPVPALYAGVAGISLVEETGVPAIADHVAGLVGAPARRSRVSRRDGGHADGSRAARAARLRPLERRRRARRRRWRRTGSSTSSREDKLRVALHLYNVDEDVDALLAALERNRALLD